MSEIPTSYQEKDPFKNEQREAIRVERQAAMGWGGYADRVEETGKLDPDIVQGASVHRHRGFIVELDS